MQCRRLILMTMVVVGILAGFARLGPALAALPSCKQVSQRIVQTGVEDVLRTALEQSPQLKGLDQATLIKQAGELFMTAERADFKVYGYMLLLWYGDAADRQRVAEAGAALKTETERSHFYFVFGLYKIGSRDPALAADGRSDLEAIRARGDVTIVPEEMWAALLRDCQLAGS